MSNLTKIARTYLVSCNIDPPVRSSTGHHAAWPQNKQKNRTFPLSFAVISRLVRRSTQPTVFAHLVMLCHFDCLVCQDGP